MCGAFDVPILRPGKMASRFHQLTRSAAIAAFIALSSLALPSRLSAQSAEDDPEMRIQRLEEQLRQLTGQNEELQYRNRQLEDRLRQLQGGAQPGPGAPSVAAVPPAQVAPAYNPPPAQSVQGGYPPPQQGYAPPQPGYRQPQPGYGQQAAAPPPIVQEPGGQRRGDAFDPSQNPSAPGAPRALGGGQLPLQEGAAVGAPGGRAPGEPLELSGSRYQQGGPPPSPGSPNGADALATAPPSNTPRDEYDLGIGYMQRKDYALAEQTMRGFAQRYPADPLLGDSQYWLGESLFQRQQYRDAAEVFLNVTSKYDKAAKAPDAMLRLGQSLAALKEREAACAAFGEVTKKYPRASAGVKAAVDRELKKTKC